MDPKTDYIDVRGAWPIYFRGAEFVRLVGSPRDVSIEEARRIFESQ